MSSETSACCPRCQAALEPDSAFCTSCGLRVAQSPAAAAASSAPSDVHSPCAYCGTPLAADAMFCTNCGTKHSGAPNMDPVTPVASPTLPVATVAIPAVVRASTAAAVEPALSSPVIQRPAPEQAPRHNAQVLLLLLFLAVVLGIVAFVFNRPKPSHVLILTPESSSVAMVGGSTAIVGVGVEGATDGLVWSVEEKNGGRVEPGGVTIQGSRIIYHAIYHAPFRGGSYHITAASRENKDQAVTIRVDVGGK